MVAIVRLSQQYAEVVEDGTNNDVRLSQQYAEVVESGTNNKIRLSQQYLEVVMTFGTPPPSQKHGKSNKSPGRNKVDQLVDAEDREFFILQRRRRFNALTLVAFLPQMYYTFPLPQKTVWKDKVSRVVY